VILVGGLMWWLAAVFQRLAVPDGPAVAPGERSSTGPGVSFPGHWDGSCEVIETVELRPREEVW